MKKWQQYKLFRLTLAKGIHTNAIFLYMLIMSLFIRTKGLIDCYCNRKRYIMPLEIYEKAMDTNTQPLKRRKSSSFEGHHYPIKAKKGQCYYCWDIYRIHKPFITTSCICHRSLLLLLGNVWNTP